MDRKFIPDSDDGTKIYYPKRSSSSEKQTNDQKTRFVGK